MKKQSFIIGSCQICKQGLLQIMKDPATANLFIWCDECEGEWKSAEAALFGINGSRNYFNEMEPPTIEEVSNFGWDHHIDNQYH